MKLEVIYHGETVGELRTGADGLPVFTYSPWFIRQGLELSPLNLPLAQTPYAIRSLRFAICRGSFTIPCPMRMVSWL